MRSVPVGLLLVLAFVPFVLLAETGPRFLRVRLYSQNPPASVSVAPRGAALLADCGECSPKPLPGPATISAVGSRVRLGDRPRTVDMVRLEGSYQLSAPAANAIPMAWPLEIRARAGRLAVVVTLPLEEYVAAVLAGEAGGFSSPEALKAMAVAARTFAARFRGRHSDAVARPSRTASQSKVDPARELSPPTSTSPDDFDFCDTTHCQDLRLGALSDRARQAALATSGELLWHRGRLARTYYHRDCGGSLEDARWVWPEAGEPYLRSKPDPYCTKRGRVPWRAKIPAAEMEEALAASGIRLPAEITSARIVERTPGGRARKIAVEGQKTALISASSLRLAVGRAMGWNLIRSDLHDVGIAQGEWVFEGFGAGHGAGMCQQGAEQMGAAGMSYRKILEFYYPGTLPGLKAQGIPWQRLGGERIALLTTNPESDRPVLELAEAALADLERRGNWQARSGIRIFVFPSVDTFRDSTGEPGWVAASTRGLDIRLQPAGTLQWRNALRATLRHELAHVLVEQNARPSLPLWFREGVAQHLAENRGQAPVRNSSTDLRALDRALREPRSQAELQEAYRTAGSLVARLVNEYGESAVLSWVNSGIPAGSL